MLVLPTVISVPQFWRFQNPEVAPFRPPTPTPFETLFPTEYAPPQIEAFSLPFLPLSALISLRKNTASVNNLLTLYV
jgi:hypothetical protein